MISYKIEYTVKKSEINRAIGLVFEFIDGIRNNEPESIIYHAYQDSTKSAEFTHIMTFKNEHAAKVHKESSYYQKFTEELFPICEKEPEYLPMILIR
jgi:quinol monooxygenase YgiN